MGFQKISRLTAAQVQQLHELFQHEWWTTGRLLEDVQQMLAHSSYVFGICEAASERLVAFARVLTDRVYKALILDVIVAAEYRDQGLGKILMEDILGHPELKAVKHFELYCRLELAPFYQRWGFSTDVGGILFMRRECTVYPAPAADCEQPT